MKDKIIRKYGFDLLYCFLWYAITGILIFVTGYFFSVGTRQLIVRLLFSLVTSSILLLYLRCVPAKVYDKNRIGHTYQRLFIFYILLYVITFFMAGIPPTMRPMFVIGICFTLLYDSMVGIYFQMYLSMLLCLFRNDSYQVVLLYLASAMLSCILATYLLKSELTFYALLILFAVNTALSGIFTYLLRGKFTVGDFLPSVMANLLGILLVFLTLFYINYRIVHGFRSKLEQLSKNDSELLLQLKKESLFLYEYSQKVGNLSEKIAAQIGKDALLVKAAGYYIKIGRLHKKKDFADETMTVIRNHRFPAEVVELMEEYHHKSENPASVEAAIIMLVDAVLSSYEYLKRKHGDLHYENNFVVDQILKKRLELDYFEKCNMTVGMYHKIRECLLMEVEKDDFSN